MQRCAGCSFLLVECVSGRQVPQEPQQAVVGVGGSWGPAADPVPGQGSESWLEEVMLFGLRPEDWVWGWRGSAHCLASAPAPVAPHLCRWRGGLRVQESCSLEAVPALGVDALHDGCAMGGRWPVPLPASCGEAVGSSPLQSSCPGSGRVLGAEAAVLSCAPPPPSACCLVARTG